MPSPTLQDYLLSAANIKPYTTKGVTAPMNELPDAVARLGSTGGSGSETIGALESSPLTRFWRTINNLPEGIRRLPFDSEARDLGLRATLVGLAGGGLTSAPGALGLGAITALGVVSDPEMRGRVRSQLTDTEHLADTLSFVTPAVGMIKAGGNVIGPQELLEVFEESGNLKKMASGIAGDRNARQHTSDMSQEGFWKMLELANDPKIYNFANPDEAYKYLGKSARNAMRQVLRNQGYKNLEDELTDVIQQTAPSLSVQHASMVPEVNPEIGARVDTLIDLAGKYLRPLRQKIFNQQMLEQAPVRATARSLDMSPSELRAHRTATREEITALTGGVDISYDKLAKGWRKDLTKDYTPEQLTTAISGMPDADKIVLNAYVVRNQAPSQLVQKYGKERASTDKLIGSLRNLRTILESQKP